MDNRVPKVITDRNGKVTTVHRKMESGKRSAPSFPVPQARASVEEDYAVLVSGIMAIVSEELQKMKRDDPAALEKSERYLRRCPDAVLSSLKIAMESHEPSRRTLTTMIFANTDATRLHEAAVFLPEIWVGHPSSSLNSVMALPRYDEFMLHKNLAFADERVQAQCIAIANVTAAIDGVCDVMKESPLERQGVALLPVIGDKRLVRLILDNPEKAPLITKFIEARFSTDYDAISELITAASEPLSEGTL